MEYRFQWISRKRKDFRENYENRNIYENDFWTQVICSCGPILTCVFGPKLVCGLGHMLLCVLGPILYCAHGLMLFCGSGPILAASSGPAYVYELLKDEFKTGR